MATVVLIEDDEQIAASPAKVLRLQGRVVEIADQGSVGLAKLNASAPDVVVLDLEPQDLDGTDFLKMIRSITDVPVIIATARDDEQMIARALDLRADEYVVKPFSGEQLDARIRAVLRRGRMKAPKVVTLGDLRVDFGAHEATLDGRTLELRRREFELLSCSAQRAGELVSRDEIAREVWKGENANGKRVFRGGSRKQAFHGPGSTRSQDHLQQDDRKPECRQARGKEQAPPGPAPPEARCRPGDDREDREQRRRCQVERQVDADQVHICQKEKGERDDERNDHHHEPVCLAEQLAHGQESLGLELEPDRVRIDFADEDGENREDHDDGCPLGRCVCLVEPLERGEDDDRSVDRPLGVHPSGEGIDRADDPSQPARILGVLPNRHRRIFPPLAHQGGKPTARSGGAPTRCPPARRGAPVRSVHSPVGRSSTGRAARLPRDTSEALDTYQRGGSAEALLARLERAVEG